jgi:hypothetical protein
MQLKKSTEEAKREIISLQVDGYNIKKAIEKALEDKVTNFLDHKILDEFKLRVEMWKQKAIQMLRAYPKNSLAGIMSQTK